jgi:hypothetical protein
MGMDLAWPWLTGRIGRLNCLEKRLLDRRGPVWPAHGHGRLRFAGLIAQLARARR